MHTRLQCVTYALGHSATATATGRRDEVNTSLVCKAIDFCAGRAYALLSLAGCRSLAQGDMLARVTNGCQQVLDAWLPWIAQLESRLQLAV